MFYVGQVLKCKVLELSKSKHAAKLSIDPRHVNANLTLQNICEGLVIAGNVASAEDHGYVIDIGIKNLRAFVTKKAGGSFCDDVTHSE